jgi:2-polyprenyl-3-methyl-5-hydroxy-6-metoxy-1,4-benzoquinol methylase
MTTASLRPPCEICGSAGWAVVHDGPVRDGAFGSGHAPAVILQCAGCGVQRLAEEFAKPVSHFIEDAYRVSLGEGTSGEAFFDAHDAGQIWNLRILSNRSVRGKVIADVGCGGGSTLDCLAGLAATTIAIEPTRSFHPALESRFDRVYSFTGEAVAELAGTVDLALCLGALDQVPSPRETLAEIAALLRPGGEVLLSLPNRAHVLMELLPDVFPSFFYRKHHRWYFDKDSLRRTAELSGLIPGQLICQQVFGLSNSIRWLRDRRPGGAATITALDSPALDGVWRATLEERCIGDILYLFARRPGENEA